MRYNSYWSLVGNKIFFPEKGGTRTPLNIWVLFFNKKLWTMYQNCFFFIIKKTTANRHPMSLFYLFDDEGRACAIPLYIFFYRAIIMHMLVKRYRWLFEYGWVYVINMSNVNIFSRSKCFLFIFLGWKI